MVIRLKDQLSIENLRHHPAELVDELRERLASGALAHADPHRDNFYELECGAHVFYIHVSPVNGKVLLLAVWRAEESARRPEDSLNLDRSAAD